MSDKAYLRQRLKELDEIRKAKGIERPNFSELNSSINSNNSSSSKKSKDNLNLENSNNQKICNNSLNLENQISNNTNSTNSQNSDNKNSNNKNTPNFKDEISDNKQTKLNSNNSKNLNRRDYDKEPLILKDYSYFFGVSLRFFSFFIGVTIVVNILFFVMEEKIEIWILFVPIIVPLAFVFYDYYAYVVRDDYKLCFKNSSVSYMLDGKLERKVDIKEIPSCLLKPFWKNKLDIESIIIVLVIMVFIFTYLLIILSQPIPREIYYFTILWFIAQLFGNIIFKIFLYIWLNKTLSGFRIFPILIIAEPVNPKLGTPSEFNNKQKYYFIYFYNEEIYNEVREYFLQNLCIDINETKKLITF